MGVMQRMLEAAYHCVDVGSMEHRSSGGHLGYWLRLVAWLPWVVDGIFQSEEESS